MDEWMEHKVKLTHLCEEMIHSLRGYMIYHN